MKTAFSKKILIWIKPLLLVLIIGGVPIVLYETGLWDFLTDKDRLQRFIDSMGVWDETIFMLLQAAQVIIAPIPGEALNMLGGYLYGTVVGVIYSTIGTTIGSYIAFALSRKFGKPFVDRFVDKQTMKRFDHVLRHKGAFIVFLLFLIPGFPKDYLCYILGLGHLSATVFLIVSGIGRLLGTILETAGGDFIRHEHYNRLFVLVGSGLVIVLIAMVFRSKLERSLRTLHIVDYKRKKAKRNEKNKGKNTSKTHESTN